MKQTKYTAFTLVELIVVITILAVLATVAFISFQGYSQSSRDTKRTSDIATISKGVQVYRAEKSSVPEPSETKTTISFSGAELVIQGYAGKSVLDTIRVKDAKDPVDNTFYTYATNANNTQFQIIALLEADLSANNYLGNPIFANYSDRILYSAGQNVGVLLNETNTPVQELGNATIELQNNSTQYKVSLGGKKVTTSTGGALQTEILGAQKNLFGWRAMDPNCPIEDIVIGDQVWAGCNSTLGSGLEWGQLDSDIDTSNYNGTIGSCYNYDLGNTATCTKSSTYMDSSSLANNWFQGTDSEGDSEFENIWGKLYSGNNIESACPIGWRVPSDDDFIEITTYLNNGVTCEIGTDWQCTGLGWGNHNTKNRLDNLANALFTPLAGNRRTDNTSFHHRGNYTYFWTSTFDGSLRYIRSLHAGNQGVFRSTFSPDFSFSVRCIKD